MHQQAKILKTENQTMKNDKNVSFSLKISSLRNLNKHYQSREKWGVYTRERERNAIGGDNTAKGSEKRYRRKRELFLANVLLLVKILCIWREKQKRHRIFDGPFYVS